MRRKPAFTNPRNKFYLDTACTHSQLCKLSVNAALYNYISHPRERNSSLKKTTLWSLRSGDNKWPRLWRSCYHRLWSLAGFTVETVYFLSFVRGPGVSKKQPNHNRKRNEREDTGSFFRKWRGQIKTIKLGSSMEHLWERQPCCEDYRGPKIWSQSPCLKCNICSTLKRLQ